MHQLLAITGTLFVMTRPSIRDDADVGVVLPPTAFPHFSPQPHLRDIHDPAWRIWKVLNPDEDPLVHLRIEVPTIVAFRPDIDAEQTSRYNISRSTPVLDFMTWLLKILVFPMMVTLTPLYGLLLYLLKDADLLESRRNRAGASTVVTNTPDILGDRVFFSILPHVFATDVELLGTSGSGHVIAAIGLQNEISICLLGEIGLPSIDTAPVLLSTPAVVTAPSSISALAVNDSGDFVAFGTSAGNIHLYLIRDKDGVSEQQTIFDNKSAVKELHFVSGTSYSSMCNSGPSGQSSTPISSANPPLIALYENGTATLWKMGMPASYSLIAPSLSCIAETHLVSVRSSNYSLVAFSLEDGSLEVIAISGHQGASSSSRLCAGNPFDRVVKVDACLVQLNDNDHIIVGAATKAGVVSLWDMNSSECLLIMDESHGTVEQLGITGIHSETCHFCGELPLDSFLVVLSTSHTVILYKACMISQTRRCSCPTSVPRQASIVSTGAGRRSRSGSTVSIFGPPSSAGRQFNVSGSSSPNTSFPVSGHGVLLRRNLEKESQRRPTENFVLPSLIDERDNGQAHPVGPLYNTLLRPSQSPKMTVTRACETTCERGGWGIADGKVIGIRRTPRSKRKVNEVISAQGSRTIQLWGFTETVLDRWECWTYEPIKSTLQASPLCSLRSGLFRAPSDSSIANIQHPHLPFTRVTSFRTSRSIAVAGFGNTIGIFRFA